MLNWRDPWHPEAGGSELYVTEVARRLRARGVALTVFSARYPGAAAAETRDGIRYVRRGGHLTVYLWAALLLLTRRLGRHDAVLEVQNGMPFLARLFTRTRVVILVHHVHREQWSILPRALARFGWFMESKVAVRVNRGAPYVAVSEVTRSELVALGVRAGDITIAWNGRPAVPDYEPAERSTAPRLVMLARLVPHKRIEHALEVVAALRDEFPGLHLRVMGSGWWADNLLARRAELGLDDDVTFLGHVSDRQKYEELSSAWVHLLPSVKEGWGLSIVEAAHVGVPSVAYVEAGGVRESILDGVTGLLATDQDDLVGKVRHLLHDAELRLDLGHKARIRSEQFSWDVTADVLAGRLGHQGRRLARSREPHEDVHHAHGGVGRSVGRALQSHVELLHRPVDDEVGDVEVRAQRQRDVTFRRRDDEEAGGGGVVADPRHLLATARRLGQVAPG